MAVERRVIRHAVDFRQVLLVLRVQVRDVVAAHRAVRGLDRQLAHAREEAVDLVGSAVGRLRHADGVVRVALGDHVRLNLRVHALGDAEACRVVGRAVDAVAARQLRKARLQRGLRRCEVFFGVERRVVRSEIDAHGNAPSWRWL